MQNRERDTIWCPVVQSQDQKENTGPSESKMPHFPQAQPPRVRPLPSRLSQASREAASPAPLLIWHLVQVTEKGLKFLSQQQKVTLPIA